MAVHKATRSNPFPQLQPQHGKSARTGAPRTSRHRPNHEIAGVMPVKAHVYQAIAEMNAGLEKAIVNLKALQGIHFFSSSGLSTMSEALCEIRAQVNRRLMTVTNERETANAGRFKDLGIRTKRR